MAFFGFGAFSTPVGQLIEQATDNAASAGNLAAHMRIVDEINETDNGPKDAVAAIRKRLTGNTKNFHIINLSLTVLETCVKNCGLRFHVKIAHKDFLGDLMKVISQKNNPPTIVKERVLGLIQYWADAFKGKPQLVAIIELYEQLKRDGIEFPPIDLDALAPVDTPERQQQQQQQGPPQQGPPQQWPPQQWQPVPGGQVQPGVPPPQAGEVPVQARVRPRFPRGPLKPEHVAKLLSELDIVRRNLDIMNEIMTENEPGKESADDFNLLEELNRVCHAMQARVADIIDHCTDEIILESTLQINDELNSVFVRYERYVRQQQAIMAEVVQPQQESKPETRQTQVANGVATTSLTEPAAPSISYPSLEEQPPAYEATAVGQLIDLGTEVQQPPQAPAGDIMTQLAELGITAEATPPQQRPREESTDEFDIFAKSRTAYSPQGVGSTYDDNLVQQTASISAKVAGRPTQQPPAATYENLSEWLAQTDLQQQPPATTQSSTYPPPADSATSAEFDQFLAQRAERGEDLTPARPRPQMQKAEDQSDELFAL